MVGRAGHWESPFSRTVALLLVFACLSFVSVAGAKQDEPAAADLLFQRGREAMAEQDFAAACGYFEASLRLHFGVGTVLNWADCEEKRGHLVAAWTKWNTGLEMLGDDDPRRTFVNQRARDVLGKIPRLTLRLHSAVSHLAKGEQVVILSDGVQLDESKWGRPLLVDPGRHQILVRAPGHFPRLYEFDLKVGQRHEVELGPGVPREEVAPDRSETHNLLAWTATGVGVLGAGTAIGTGLLLPRQKKLVDKNCEGTVCNPKGVDAADRGKRLLVLNSIGWSAAGVGLIAGSVLFITLPHSDRSSARSVAQFDLRPSSARLLVSGTF